MKPEPVAKKSSKQWMAKDNGGYVGNSSAAPIESQNDVLASQHPAGLDIAAHISTTILACCNLDVHWWIANRNISCTTDSSS